jgi:TrmH family RNA methyltransferase
VKTITSLANETVKAVRALHMRKARDESGLFLVEGLRSVTQAVELGQAPRILLYGERAANLPALARAATVAGESAAVTPAILAKISRRENPQMVLGVFEQRFTEPDKLDPARDGVFVGLEEVRDPGNLGTILRTIDASGAAGLVLIGDCCDPYSVEAVRASMGSVFAVPIARLSRDAFLPWRARWPGSVIGTLLTASKDFRGAVYRRPSLILLGNEQAGLTQDLAASCDLAVKIPMRGRADSLNLAVAAGLMIYAATAEGAEP